MRETQMRAANAPSGVRRIEVACDESGFTGGNLIGPERIFAHASVRLDAATASTLVEEVSARLGVRGGELKAARLLRARHRATLLWLLGSTVGLGGSAVVHLTDTRLFTVARLLTVVLEDGPHDGTSCPGRDASARRRSVALQRLGARCVGAARWRQFLLAAVDLMWTNSRWVPPEPVARFFGDLDQLRTVVVDEQLSGILQELASGRERADRARARYAGDSSLTPLLAPLIPALTCAVRHWSAAADEVVVTHDEQSTLTRPRVAAIATSLRNLGLGCRLTVLPDADSRQDPRIQVADWLAGTARRVASDGLGGRLDHELWELLQPLRAFPCDSWLAVGTTSSA